MAAALASVLDSRRAGWQITIDLYDDAGLLEGRVTPADVRPGGELPGPGRRPGR